MGYYEDRGAVLRCVDRPVNARWEDPAEHLPSWVVADWKGSVLAFAYTEKAAKAISEALCDPAPKPEEIRP
jgi:hypothetical protein